ncbi:LAMI_0D05270g1_1 [Lachancea mirantina]|uniref:LAMI_0D05270g1_1 n=1 Tax=Lachancea mirantina TaxID=1230905 RepID=A0A1G4JB12_9SACH|nr:LAMI_0D05270g1_1 [Lachancea mirantina]
MSIFSTPLKSGIDYTQGVGLPLSDSIEGQNQTKLTNNQGTSNSVATANYNGFSGTNSLLPSNTQGHVRVTGFDKKQPLELANFYVDNLQREDASTPVLDERSYYNNGVTYNFTKEVGGLGAFTPFERTEVINIPDELLQEASKAEMKNDMGLFPELNRCWITIDNKLVLWNIKNSADYQSIDDIKHPILAVGLVRPKPKTFVENINHLLLIATPFDIYVLAVSYDETTEEINVFNTGIYVSVNGLDVSAFIAYERTGQIFFVGNGSGNHVWELQYSKTDDWFNSKCNKVCLTKSALSSLMPVNLISKLPGSNLLQSLFEDDHKNGQERIIQLTADQSRGVLYTLSSRSVVRAYKINGKSLDGPLTIETSYIKRIMGTTAARGAPILGNKYLKISKIIAISLQENSNLFLVAITIGGVRLCFNGSLTRTSVEALRLESIKFPPSSVTPEALEQEIQQQQQKKLVPFYSSLTSSETVVLKFQKKSSVLLETSSASTIISPGIFVCPVLKTLNQDVTQANQNAQQQLLPDEQQQRANASKHNLKRTIQNKLLVSIPDYGILKNHSKYVENCCMLDTTTPVRHIAPITPLFNATNKPEGYANEFATQYSVQPLSIAVLTSTTLEIYRYRTPDAVFETLIDNPLPFVLKYGLTEACSTALFVTCKFNKSETLRSKALTFFTVGIPGAIDIKPKYSVFNASAVTSLLTKPSMISTPQKLVLSGADGNPSNSSGPGSGNYSLDNVILSPRFYGAALLIARMFRDIWNKAVFETNINAKFDSQSQLIKSSATEDSIISGVSILKSEIEYHLSSIMIINEFFNTYGNSISSISVSPFHSGKAADRSEEVANQAENIAINSLIKLTQSMKEALSFLNVLYEESEVEGFEGQYVAFKEIIKYLNVDHQNELRKLTFKEIFAPNHRQKDLVREILSSIINRNISKGGSIEYIASALQERCGSFCSSGDVLGFRAVEHLRKAKEIGSRDMEAAKFHLENAIKLFGTIVDNISTEKLKEAVNIMLGLNYFPGTIEFLLNIANSIDKGKLAYQYVADGFLEEDERKTFYEKRLVIYDMVFETLVRIDDLSSAAPAFSPSGFGDGNDLAHLREESYKTALNYNDKLFHYELYDWLVSQKSQDKLLQLDTEFILPYLKEKAKNSLEISNLLWVYLSKRSQFLAASEILYSLVISDFEIPLAQRIEYLSRANGFCNGVCTPSERQEMIQLAGMIQEIFDVAAIQDDILNQVKSDNRVSQGTKDELCKQLDGKILPVSDLFNDFADPLGYSAICLAIFKISDFRNNEEILSKWMELFNKLKEELVLGGDSGPEATTNFIQLLSAVVIRIGRNVRTSEFVFPVEDLLPIISDLFQDNLSQQHINAGSVTSIFITAGVPYDKMYYLLKKLIETAESNSEIYQKEMVWLIKEWYAADRKIRDILDYDEVRNLTAYSIEKDPIENYAKRTGNCI